MQKICLVALIFVFSAVLAYSEEDSVIVEKMAQSKQAQAVEEHNGFIYVKAFYELGENDTMANARDRLKQKALQMVSEYKGGEYSSSELIIKGSDSDSGDNLRYFNSASLSTLGFIEKLESLKEEPTLNKLTAYYKVRYRILEGKKPEFGFIADMKNRRMHPGDRIMVDYSIQTNAFLYFFDLYADTAALIFPNSRNSLNFIHAGKYIFPSEADSKNGIHFDVSLPEGKSESMEIIRAVVTRRQMNFDSVTTPEDILKILFQMRRDEFEFIDLGFSIKE
jgi:hypothetical protein